MAESLGLYLATARQEEMDAVLGVVALDQRIDFSLYLVDGLDLRRVVDEDGAEVRVMRAA